jgi:predicted transcriptional regulator
MTHLLDVAYARASALSESQQDEIARKLLALMGDADATDIPDEHKAEIDAAIAEIERGEIASEEEMKAVFDKFRL